MQAQIGLRKFKTAKDGGQFQYPVWDESFSLFLRKGAPHTVTFSAKTLFLGAMPVRLGVGEVELDDVFCNSLERVCIPITNLKVRTDGAASCYIHCALLRRMPAPMCESITRLLTRPLSNPSAHPSDRRAPRCAA